ncbi:MAG TPA: hypothetical protein VLF94_06960 [Chlamydiales bacterium]|nr:hypothetical protein [Chlamydiales bacterium]
MAAPSFPPGWPVRNPPFFAHSCSQGGDRFTLQPEKLPKNRCHLFFHPEGVEMSIVKALEFITFHPDHEPANKLISVIPLKLGNLDLFWFSCPKEFKDVCGRAAEIFKVKMAATSRVMVKQKDGKRATYEFPEHEDVLMIKGGANQRDPEDCLRWEKEAERAIDFGDALQKMGLD